MGTDPVVDVFEIADVIEAIGDIVDGGIDWISSTVGLITDEPLLLFFVLSSFLGVGIGLFKRILR